MNRLYFIFDFVAADVNPIKGDQNLEKCRRADSRRAKKKGVIRAASCCGKEGLTIMGKGEGDLKSKRIIGTTPIFTPSTGERKGAITGSGMLGVEGGNISLSARNTNKDKIIYLVSSGRENRVIEERILQN